MDEPQEDESAEDPGDLTSVLQDEFGWTVLFGQTVAYSPKGVLWKDAARVLKFGRTAAASGCSRHAIRAGMRYLWSLDRPLLGVLDDYEHERLAAQMDRLIGAVLDHVSPPKFNIPEPEFRVRL